MAGALEPGPDGRLRCPWGVAPADYRSYHDEEWGRPLGGESALLERLCLEGFQAGLSWLTILRKREAFRRAFAGFDVARVAAYGEAEVEGLLADPGIVRHRGKVTAAIANARAVEALWAEGRTLAEVVWAEEPRPPPPPPPTMADLATVSPGARRLSAELRRRGFRFLGPTTVHAALQAVGVVDDHLEGCFVRAEVEAERAAFSRPRGPGPPAR